MSGFQLLFWSSIVIFMALIFKFFSVIFCFLQSDFSSEDEKMGNKPKLKRGIFGKSTKRKSNSRPSSEFIACEMTTMSEEDRINLMRSVKNGEMSVEQALKRFVRYKTIFFLRTSKDSTHQYLLKGLVGFFTCVQHLHWVPIFMEYCIWTLNSPHSNCLIANCNKEPRGWLLRKMSGIFMQIDVNMESDGQNF